MNKSTVVAFSLFLFLVLFVCGCGKHESSGAAMGAITGGTLGVLASNDPQGAILGATIGGLLGGSLGAEEDRAVERNEHREHVQALANENYALKKAQERWCASCCVKVNLVGAQSCPKCGDDLIVKKFCKHCGSTFSPKVPYRYCPYCKGGISLSGM